MDTSESVQWNISVLMVLFIVEINFESTSYSAADTNGLMNDSYFLAAWIVNSDIQFWSMVYALIVLLF